MCRNVSLLFHHNVVGAHAKRWLAHSSSLFFIFYELHCCKKCNIKNFRKKKNTTYTLENTVYKAEADVRIRKKEKSSHSIGLRFRNKVEIDFYSVICCWKARPMIAQIWYFEFVICCMQPWYHLCEKFSFKLWFLLWKYFWATTHFLRTVVVTKGFLRMFEGGGGVPVIAGRRRVGARAAFWRAGWHVQRQRPQGPASARRGPLCIARARPLWRQELPYLQVGCCSVCTRHLQCVQRH